MEQRSNSFLETEKISSLMGKYAVPCIISLLMAALYNIVDQIFIANADYLGSYGNAANTVVFPLTVVALAIAVMIGDGCCAFVSLCLGANEKENAHRSIGNAIVLCIAAGLVLTALYFLFQDPILTLFGGRINEETFLHSKEYFTYITMGIPFYMFGQALNPIIRSDGSPGFAMVSTLAGAVANIIFDPILIFNFNMGVAGAALATVISQVAGTILGLYYNLRKNPEIRFAWTYLRPSKPVIARIYGVGIPSILLQTVSSLLIFGLNQILVVFSETATAVYGVYFKLQGFAFLPIIGMNNGMVPIIAYNYGAKKPDRVKRTIKLAVLSAMGIMAVGFAVFEIAPGALLSFFDASENMLAIGAPALRIIALSFILAGFCIIAGSVCQAIGNPFYSLIVSVCRQLVVLLPVAWLLSQTGNLTLVWLAFPIAELMSLTLSIIFLRKTLRMADAAMASGKAGA